MSVFARFSLVGLIPLLIIGCGGEPDKPTQAIDPPPVERATESVNSDQSKKKEQDQKTTEVELYFRSSTGHIVPYSVELPQKKEILKESLQYMVDKEVVGSQIPKEFQGVIPKGTQVNGIDVQRGVATIDFSSQFTNYEAKEEEDILSAITWTLTGFDAVDKVNIKVAGKSLTKMPKGDTPAQGLTREDGINLEVAEGVNINQSMPVTLYFLGQTRDNQVYYVPVTRMVERTDRAEEVVLQQLVKGPEQGSNLLRALDTTTNINQVTVKDKTVMADVGKQILQYNNQKTASQNAIDTIVLSLTENTDATQVKITVDGKQSVGVFSKEGKNIDTPITRPDRINPKDI